MNSFPPHRPYVDNEVADEVIDGKGSSWRARAKAEANPLL